MVEGGWEAGRGGEGLHGGPRTTMTRQVDALLGHCFWAICGQGRLWSAAFFSSSCNDVTQSGTAPQSERTVQRGLE